MFLEEWHDLLTHQPCPWFRFVTTPAFGEGNHSAVLLCDMMENLGELRKLCPQFLPEDRKTVARCMRLHGFRQLEGVSVRTMCPSTSARSNNDLFYHPAFQPRTTDFTPFNGTDKLLRVVYHLQQRIQDRNQEIAQLCDLRALYHQGVLDITAPDGTFDYLVDGLEA